MTHTHYLNLLLVSIDVRLNVSIKPIWKVGHIPVGVIDSWLDENDPKILLSIDFLCVSLQAM